MSSREEIKSRSYKAARLAVLGALAVALTALEYMLPIEAVVPVPGFKLGLANIAVLFAVRNEGFFASLGITAVKVAASALVAGTPVSFLFSLCGSVSAFLITYLLHRLLKDKVGCLGLGVAGAFFHNTAQVAVAAMMLGGYAFSYLPFLAAAAVISGVLTGITAAAALFALEKAKKS